MPHTLLAIQYTPRAAGMTEQNHRLIRGIIMFITGRVGERPYARGRSYQADRYEEKE